MKKQIVDVTTGEEVIIDMSKEDIEQYTIIDFEKEQQLQKFLLLEKLGITEEEAKLLLS